MIGNVNYQLAKTLKMGKAVILRVKPFGAGKNNIRAHHHSTL